MLNKKVEIINGLIAGLEKMKNEAEDIEVVIDTGIEEIGQTIDGKIYGKRYSNIFITYNDIHIKDSKLDGWRIK